VIAITLQSFTQILLFDRFQPVSVGMYAAQLDCSWLIGLPYLPVTMLKIAHAGSTTLNASARPSVKTMALPNSFMMKPPFQKSPDRRSPVLKHVSFLWPSYMIGTPVSYV